MEPWPWPVAAEELMALQVRLGEAATLAVEADPWVPAARRVLVGGCYVAPARRTRGPGRAGDPVWAAAVVWPATGEDGPRRTDRHLLPGARVGEPRRADDVVAHAVIAARVAAPYRPGFLAARDGPVLAAVLSSLDVRPEVVLVDATGTDHPRGAGLAVHLGAAIGLATVGVTRRPLVATGTRPALRRGERSPLVLDGRCVAHWLCTRDGAQPLVVHAGWRTTPERALRIVMEATTPGARTPVPLQEARRVAREARSAATDVRREDR